MLGGSRQDLGKKIPRSSEMVLWSCRMCSRADTSAPPLIGWLKQLRGDANAIIVYILNIFAYNEMKIRAGVVGSGLAAHVLNPVLAEESVST